MTIEPNTPAHQASEDIDLILLLERIYLFLKRYFWLFLCAIVLGLLSGYLFYRSLPKLYKSRLLLHSFILTNQEHIQIINNWNELLQKQELDELSSILNCPKSILYPVRQIKPEEIQKVFAPENPNGFTIEVTLTDIQQLDKLEKGIVYGLENSPYIKDRIDAKKASLEDLIRKTTIEINRLDSTKLTMERILDGRGHNSTSLILDGSNINRQLIEINEKLSFFKQDLQFAKAVQVLQHFSKFHKPIGPNKMVWLALGVICFVSVAYVYALFRSISRRLRARKT